MTIKPEDVTDKLAIGLFHNVAGVTLDACKYNVAAIINAAIEAGVVSPPCWIARMSNGQLVSGTVYPSKDDADRYKWTSDNVEHWKGQTE
jgi:hypothetical protein